MGLQVLLYTRALPTRLAVQDAFAEASAELVESTSPVDLLEKLQQRSWDAVVLDGDSSPVPLSKLLAGLRGRVDPAKTVVLAMTRQAEPLPPLGEVLLYNRPVRRRSLLGSLNRLLLARRKKPILPARAAAPGNKRRALRVPLLVPVEYSFPDLKKAWVEGESLDVSISGARIAASGALSSISPGQPVDVKNLLTGQQAVFRVVWVAEDLDEIAVGIKADQEDVRFWLAS